MKASKEGKFSLELPDGAPLVMFEQALTALMSDAPMARNDEFDRQWQDLQDIFQLGPMPSKQAATIEIRDRARRLLDATNQLHAVLHRDEAALPNKTFGDDVAAVRTASARLRDQEDADNKKYAWIFSLMNVLMTELHISDGKNQDIAKEAERRLGRLMAGLERLRETVQVGRATNYPRNFDGYEAALMRAVQVCGPGRPVMRPRSRPKRH
jgi:hypothetical protein